MDQAAQTDPDAHLAEDKKATERLANERTFLAWVRTSIAVTSLGFVVAKFGVWLHDLSTRVSPGPQQRPAGMSLPIGVSMMAFGGVLALLAVYRFRKVNQAIDEGSVSVDRGLVYLITAALVMLSLVMIAYVVLTVAR